MTTLEETVAKELVPVGPAREVFKRLAEFFSTDVDLVKSMSQKLNEIYPQNHVPYHTVESSFHHPKQSRMQKRISDLALDWGRQLSDFLEGDQEKILQGELVNVAKFLRYKRNEAPRICKEIRAIVEPLIDFYQFESKRKLARYLVDVHSTKQSPLTYSLIDSIFTGHKYKTLTPDIVRLYSIMLDMKRRAEDGVPIEVHPHYIQTKKGKIIQVRDYVMRRKDTKKPESLNDFIGRALEELLTKVNPEDRGFVEDSVEKFRRVKQLKDLESGIVADYGFQSVQAMYDLFFDILDLDVKRHTPLEGRQKGIKKPSNLHRKLYVVALILRDAKDRGIPVNINPKYFKYLMVSKHEYMREIRYMQRKRIDGIVLAEGLSLKLDLSLEGADDYVGGNRNSMVYVKYLKLRELRKSVDDIFTVDFSDERRKLEEFKRFMDDYRGGRVLVKTNKELSPGDIRMLQEIRDIVYDKGGFPFLFPTPTVIIKQLYGYIPHDGLFREPDYSKIVKAFRSPH